jgi:hypothetical protein
MGVSTMFPSLFHRKDRLVQPPLVDSRGEGACGQGDPGYSAMTWWSARILL